MAGRRRRCGLATEFGACLRFHHGGRGDQPRDAYTQGKALTYQKLVCASCPIQKGELNRERAISLKDSLEARDEADKPGTPDDDHIKVLGRDEQEMVHYFLTRRYRL